MDKIKMRNQNRIRKKKGIRSKIYGTTDRPRLTVYRSAKHIYVQAIDDDQQITLTSCSTLEKDLKNNQRGNQEGAKVVGNLIAKRLLEKGYKSIIFDRNGYIYHGRIKAVADAAREAGLQF